MAFEPELSEHAERFLASIRPWEREQFFQGLSMFIIDPFPDGKTKVEIPFPYKPGTLGTSFGQFWLAYTLRGNERLIVLTVYWSRESGRNPGANLL